MKLISRRNIGLFLWQRLVCLFFGTLSVSLLTCKQRKIHSLERPTVKGNFEILNETGDFLVEVNRLKRLAIPKDSNRYQPPTADELKSFSSLANALLSQDFNGVLNKANALNYELVQFFDTPTGQVLYGVREKLVQGRTTRGWGSYFINPACRTNALVEVPHVLFDRFSEEIGAKTFLISAAYGFLIAGAHRNANGIGTADVCHSISSVFQEVHKAWVLPKIKTWQIHGFGILTRPTLPNGTQSVLSDGQGTVSSEVLDLSQRMNAQGFQSYIYNQSLASPLLDQQVNQGVAGTTFSHLGGTRNKQGIYCHSIAESFIHIELDQSIRDNSAYRDVVARIIAGSIQAVA